MEFAPVSHDVRSRSTIVLGSALDRIISELGDQDLSRVPGNVVEALLRANPIAAADLEPYFFFVPGRYTRNVIYRDAAFEVLALCWSAGARSPIHDHGQSRCFVQIQVGALVGDEYTLVSGGREPGPAQLAHVRTQTLTTGDIDVRTPTRDIHRFVAADGPAVSLHIYAKPIERFLFFDTAAEVCHPRRSRYDEPGDSDFIAKPLQ